MKFVKTLLLTTVASGLVASGALAHGANCGSFEGIFVRGQLGASQGIKAKRDSLLPGSQGGTRSKNFGWHGGAGVEMRQSLSHMHPSLVGGVLADVNFESTKNKQSGKPLTAGGTLNAEVKRQITVNVLGQLAWKVKHNVMPYILAGGSFAKFKFSETWSNTSTTTATSRNKNIVGWSTGLGLAIGINNKWSSDIRYLYTQYGKVNSVFNVHTTQNTAKAPSAYHAITLGVSYKI